MKRVSATGNGTVTISGVQYTGGDEYFFVKVIQTDEDREEQDRAWLAPVWFEPNATAAAPASPAAPPASSGPSLALDVDLLADEATITNLGEQTVTLTDWTLVSVKGDQKFKFPAGFRCDQMPSIRGHLAE